MLQKASLIVLQNINVIVRQLFVLFKKSTTLWDNPRKSGKKKYRSTLLSQSPREWRKYFELFEVRHKQNVTSPKYDVHVQFLQGILLQYMHEMYKNLFLLKTG